MFVLNFSFLILTLNTFLKIILISMPSGLIVTTCMILKDIFLMKHWTNRYHYVASTNLSYKPSFCKKSSFIFALWMLNSSSRSRLAVSGEGGPLPPSSTWNRNTTQPFGRQVNAHHGPPNRCRCKKKAWKHFKRKKHSVECNADINM